MPPIPGFYIAHCPLLEVGLGKPCVKVGHSGDLRARLHESAYITCFPPDSWRYAYCFELDTKLDAAVLEAAVLHCMHDLRLAPRELVMATADRTVAVASAAAAVLGLAPRLRHAPLYPARVPAARAGTQTANSAAASERVRAASGALEVAMAALLPAASERVPAASSPLARSPLLPAPQHQAAPLLKDGAGHAEEFELLDVAVGDTVIDPPAAELVLRDYQRSAAADVCRELQTSSRTILQMACRCGKTAVAFSVAAQLRARRILFLVPGLSLLRQTVQKLASYGRAPLHVLAVGSDSTPIPVRGRALAMTTDPGAIAAFLQPGRAADEPLADEPLAVSWTVCTYQSSPLLAESLHGFDLVIADEAHRMTGARAARPFTATLLSPQLGRALFMTATPVYDPVTPLVISMSDRALFGGVASRYNLRAGIDAGHVNGFRLELVGVPAGAPAARSRKGASASTAIAGAGTAIAATVNAIMLAAATVEKLLVFCRDIAHADELAAAVRAAAAAVRTAAAAHTLVAVAHSRMPAGGAARALQEFAAPGVRAILFNCRMLQEGVEVAALNAVFFAAPRHSPRDIIQSICRPLNKFDGKPQSVVFLPVEYDPEIAPDADANLERYSSILPVVDALLDEDPQLFDYLMTRGGAGARAGPGARAGTSAPLAPLVPVLTAIGHTALLPVCCRVIRHGVAGARAGARRPPERLLRADAIPFERAYEELRRVVHECRRYPKTTDEWVVAGDARVNLHAVYKGLADRYTGASTGTGVCAGAAALEPYQRAALEQLPGWLPWGAQGPYAWGPCMETLERWLAERGPDTLAIEINKGGYVGLEATPLERLSGALTCVNQQVFGKAVRERGADGAVAVRVHAADRVPAAHAADLDRICARFGLRWRKEFRADGTVDSARPTFIQEAYGRFKALYAAGGSDHPYVLEHFPGYPLKHARQCALDLVDSPALPPRKPRAGCRPKKSPAVAADI